MLPALNPSRRFALTRFFYRFSDQRFYFFLASRENITTLGSYSFPGPREACSHFLDEKMQQSASHVFEGCERHNRRFWLTVCSKNDAAL
jgi:hypothetical protein